MEGKILNIYFFWLNTFIVEKVKRIPNPKDRIQAIHKLARQIILVMF